MPESVSAPVRLTVYRQDGPLRQYRLTPPGPCRLGRAPDNDIVVDDTRVSRYHLSFHPEAGHWRFSELGSKNGTRLDGRPVTDGVLNDGAWLSLGGVPVYCEWLTDRVARREQARDQARRQTSVIASRRLQADMDRERLLDETLRSMTTLADASRAVLRLCQRDGTFAVVREERPADETVEGADWFEALIEEAGRRGGTIVRRHGEPDQNGRVTDGICLPLSLSDRLLGQVCLEGGAREKGLTELDLELLEGMAAQAALAIAVSSVRDRIHALGKALPVSAAEIERDAELQALLEF